MKFRIRSGSQSASAADFAAKEKNWTAANLPLRLWLSMSAGGSTDARKATDGEPAGSTPQGLRRNRPGSPELNRHNPVAHYERPGCTIEEFNHWDTQPISDSPDNVLVLHEYLQQLIRASPLKIRAFADRYFR